MTATATATTASIKKLGLAFGTLAETRQVIAVDVHGCIARAAVTLSGAERVAARRLQSQSQSQSKFRTEFLN